MRFIPFVTASKIRLSLVFLLLIAIQIIYSFFFPAYNPRTNYWKTLQELNFSKGYSLSNADTFLTQKLSWLITNYHMNGDVGGYVVLAHDFPQQYFRGHLTFLTRPLYPFLVHLVAVPLHWLSNSYAVTFGAGLFLTIVLFFITLHLFYILTEQRTSKRVAFLACCLLIFSPFTHVWLIQPETNIYGAFALITSLYLLWDYTKHPSLKHLIAYSLIIGLLLLGKKFFAISFFIMFLGIYAKRYRETAIFLAIHLLPWLGWYIWVTRIWHLPFYMDELSFGVGIWLLDMLHWPWYAIIKKVLDVIPDFVSCVIYGFLLVPLPLAFIGYRQLSFKHKHVISASFIAAFLLLFFITNLYMPRHAFLLFPLVYPSAILGIDAVASYLKKFNTLLSQLAPVVFYSILIILAQVNFYLIIPFG